MLAVRGAADAECRRRRACPWGCAGGQGPDAGTPGSPPRPRRPPSAGLAASVPAAGRSCVAWVSGSRASGFLGRHPDVARLRPESPVGARSAVRVPRSTPAGTRQPWSERGAPGLSAAPPPRPSAEAPATERPPWGAGMPGPPRETGVPGAPPPGNASGPWEIGAQELGLLTPAC